MIDISAKRCDLMLYRERLPRAPPATLHMQARRLHSIRARSREREQLYLKHTARRFSDSTPYHIARRERDRAARPRDSAVWRVSKEATSERSAGER